MDEEKMALGVKARVSGLDQPVVWLGVIGGTLLAVFLCDWMWWISIPLVASVVLYYIALPIIEWLERRGLDHSKALWVFILGLTLLAAVLGPALLSWFTTQAYLVQEKLPAVLNRINETLGSPSWVWRRNISGCRRRRWAKKSMPS